MASHRLLLWPPVWGVELQPGGSGGPSQGAGGGLCWQTFAQPCVEHGAARCGQTCICKSNAFGLLQYDGCTLYDHVSVHVWEHFDAIAALQQLVRHS